MNKSARETLSILLVDEQKERFELLSQTFSEFGYRVVASVGAHEDINAAVERFEPDVIIADLDSPGRDTLEHMQTVTRDHPRPIVMFTNDGDAATIEMAVKAGVSAYVLDGINPERIQPILDVAISRFKEYQQLRNELEQTRLQLTERKVIEKAKGILMKKRGMEEDQAYQCLRKMAMDRNLKISELAQSIIAAADLLE